MSFCLSRLGVWGGLESLMLIIGFRIFEYNVSGIGLELHVGLLLVSNFGLDIELGLES